MITKNNPFSNLFDISAQDPDKLVIKESAKKDNCYIYEGADIVGGFILVNKLRVKTIIKITFYKSSKNNRYIPRLEFRKEEILCCKPAPKGAKQDFRKSGRRGHRSHSCGKRRRWKLPSLYYT